MYVNEEELDYIYGRGDRWVGDSVRDFVKYARRPSLSEKGYSNSIAKSVRYQITTTHKFITGFSEKDLLQ